MVSLEPVEQPVEPDMSEAPPEEATEEPPEDASEEARIPEEPPEPEPTQTTEPTPKRRGRPNKDPSKPKQAVRINNQPAPVPSSSEEESMSNHDMETMLIDYLYRRKWPSKTHAEPDGVSWPA